MATDLVTRPRSDGTSGGGSMTEGHQVRRQGRGEEGKVNI
jgi:hypothetical protein